MPSGRRRASGRRGRAPLESSRRPGSGRYGRRWAIGLAALIAAGVAIWMVRHVAPPNAPPGSAALLEAAQARTRALSLARAGRHLEAIPYFRTVVTRDPGSWSAHLNLASSLGNGAQQARTLSGLDMIATRSSVERIAMVNESVAETEAAGRLAPDAASRAMALFENGRAMGTWGFPIDALVRFRAAAALAPGRADIAEALRRAERELATGTP